MKDKTKNIIIAILIIIIILLIIGLIYIGIKNEFLEEKYEYLNENNYHNSEINNDNNISNNNSNNNYISKDKVLNIALKDLKIDQSNIRDLDIELEYKVKYNKTVYEVSFDYNYLEYEYYIDPESGKILDSFKSLS